VSRKFPAFNNLSRLTVIVIIGIMNNFHILVYFFMIIECVLSLNLQLLITSMHDESMLPSLVMLHMHD
jgi:hypothetical protein